MRNENLEQARLMTVEPVTLQEVQRPGGPAEALRRAQSATMREFPHPFAWAAFGLTGAPR